MSKTSAYLCVFPGKSFRTMVAFVLSMLFCAEQGRAQLAPNTEYQIKAAFLYNFTQFISWPDPSFVSQKDPFVIGILGNNPFSGYLEETIKGENVQGHKIVVKKYSDVREIQNCQMLFIPGDNTEQLKKMLSVLPGPHTLTVGENNQFTKAGGMIRFFTRDNKIRFEINVQAAKAANLDISSKLLRVADIYTSDTE